MEPTPERIRHSHGVTVAPIAGTTKETRQQFKTILGEMVRRGQLELHLRTSFDAYCIAKALAQGAMGASSAFGSNHMISSYSDAPQGGFGSRTPSNEQLDNTTLTKLIEDAIPDELWPVFIYLVQEEVGGYAFDRRTPQFFGRELMGFKSEKQATAAGKAQCRDVCSIVHKRYHELQRRNKKPRR